MSTGRMRVGDVRGVSAASGMLGSLIIATVGAVVLLFLLGVIESAMYSPSA